jgi:CheY-like chemotaxis protein/predicted phosphodiesterase
MSNTPVRNRRILWAEDNGPLFDENSGILTTYLRDRGVEVEIDRAVDGNAVFRLLGDRPYDLLLLDIDMPHYNGIETIRTVAIRYPRQRQMVVSRHLEDASYKGAVQSLKNEGVIVHAFDTSAQEDWCVGVFEELRFEPLVLLHFSDIHFGIYHAFTTGFSLAHVLHPELERIQRERRITGVVISGDLTSTSVDADYEAAKHFILGLAELLELKPEQFVIVPGNHDISRNQPSPRRFQRFVEFLDDLFGRKGAAFRRKFPRLLHRSRLTWNYNSSEPADIFSITEFPRSEATVVGMNSVYGGIGERKEDYGKGEVAQKQLIAIRSALDGRQDRHRIAVFHHHLFPVAAHDNSEDRILANQGLVLRRLIDLEFTLVLHGHSHYPAGHSYLPRMMYESPSGRAIHVFSTGTLSGKHLNKASSFFHFNVVECLQQEIRVESHKLNVDDVAWEQGPPIALP